MQASAIFETVLYANDLATAERFYRNVLGSGVHLPQRGASGVPVWWRRSAHF